MMIARGDFHLHTNASDGKLSPQQLVSLSKDKSIDIIAITDHDTTLGVDASVDEGLKIGIKVIPGIELSTVHNGESIHLLGFFRDDSFKSSSFQDHLQSMKDNRVTRAKKIIENLYTCFGIKLDYNRVYESAKGVIARPHIARAIIETGYTDNWDYIFETLIGNNSPAYVPNKKVTIPEGIQLLRSVNALVFLAHPVLIKKSKIEDILQFGFDGVEAIYPLNKDEDTVAFKNLADKMNLLISAGSDFHGGEEIDTKHGSLGSVSLQGQELEKLLKKL